MRNRTVLLQFAVLLALGTLAVVGTRVSHAQEVDYLRFTPLDVGNEWHYEVRSLMGHSVNFPYLVVRVDRDTLVNGSQRFVLQERRLDALREEIQRHECIFRLSDEGLYEGCHMRLGFPSWTASSPPLVKADTTIRIGSDVVEVAYEAMRGYSISGTMGSGGGGTLRYASDIGQYFHWAESFDRGGAVSSSTETVLVYAKVGENTYGSEVTALSNEGTLPAIADLGIHVYPNPARERITLDVVGSMTGIHVEVFDMLGRLQIRTEFAGSHHELDVSSLPSGLYLVRVSSGAAVATGMFVRAGYENE